MPASDNNFSYEFERPSAATDIAVFTCVGTKAHVLLIKRGENSYKGHLALPGGFLHRTEDLDGCAKRVLKTKTGLKRVNAHHFRNFSDPARDKRWVVSAAYFALLPMPHGLEKADTGKDQPMLMPLDDALEQDLAFDHNQILRDGKDAVGERLWDLDIAAELIHLLPRDFTLRQLQDLYQEFKTARIDRGNFRRKLKSSGILSKLVPTSEFEKDAITDMAPANRPAQLFRFK